MGMHTLRLMTCGSVDDGKSTLIGRLLYESKGIFTDQLTALQEDSKRYGTQGDAIDFALLLDGLQAEREQGITIDVAYRFFATDKRHYVIADTPGHEQYTRNMATAASTAQLAIILVDARHGIMTQTHRHHRIISMMGIRHVVLAVNKMDLVDFSPDVFHRIVSDYRLLQSETALPHIQAIPLSALHGDNVFISSQRMPWYEGPTLSYYLDGVHIEDSHSAPACVFPVQWVNRPHLDYRGYCGRMAHGALRIGDKVRILPSGMATTVRGMKVGATQLDIAHAGDSIAITVEDDVDVSRGDVVVHEQSPASVADQFQVKLLWMAETPLLPGRSYRLKIHNKEVSATVTALKFREDIESMAHLAVKELALNEIAVATLSLSSPVVFMPYTQSHTLGGFILIDKLTHATVGAGLIEFALRRSTNVTWQPLDVQKHHRAMQKRQRPLCIWLTGLSGAGKSTIANRLEKHLHVEGVHTYLLDGDNLRHNLSRDLGFSAADRVENVRRLSEVAALMVDAGLVVIVSSISPFRAEREAMRERLAPGEFIEVFVDTPLPICAYRDPKGLYAKARQGQLTNLTGIDSPYEPPLKPELRIDTTTLNPDQAAFQISEYVMQLGGQIL